MDWYLICGVIVGWIVASKTGNNFIAGFLFLINMLIWPLTLFVIMIYLIVTLVGKTVKSLTGN